MNKILIYTYRTFPWIEDLQTLSSKILVLNKLKEDIQLIDKELTTESYSLILGIAKTNKKSTFETKGVNKFNKGEILHDGADSFSLNYPKGGYKNIGINNSYTTSFCNRGIYQTANLLKKKNSHTEHLFVHITRKDINILKEYLTNKELLPKD